MNYITSLALFIIFYFQYNIFSNFEEKTNLSSFGYIAYSGFNVGDDIQMVAARRFLPSNSVPINRETIAQFTHNTKIHTIVNGWFMLTKDMTWPWLEKPPKKSWPPSCHIDPLFISIHLTPDFLPVVFSHKNIAYLKKYAPIGARDEYTLQKLRKKRIPSYFSGCLTLTLESSFPPREEVIYAVDIDKSCLNALKKYTHHKIIELTHWIPLSKLNEKNYEKRCAYATSLLEKYQKAKCVITGRLHAALPCLAFETPVLFIAESDARFGGLKNLTRHCTQKEFINGDFDFDFDNPSENPKDYLPIRENLIKTVEKWVLLKSKSVIK